MKLNKKNQKKMKGCHQQSAAVNCQQKLATAAARDVVGHSNNPMKLSKKIPNLRNKAEKNE